MERERVGLLRVRHKVSSIHDEECSIRMAFVVPLLRSEHRFTCAHEFGSPRKTPQRSNRYDKSCYEGKIIGMTINSLQCFFRTSIYGQHSHMV